MSQRAKLAKRRHPELGEVSAYCFYATRLRYNDLAFDVGANHGSHTAEMLRRGARVVAVEPQALLATELRQRFPAATVITAAVSEREGQAFLNSFAENDEWASLESEVRGRHTATSSAERHLVAVTTLDSLIEEFGPPRLAKIDTEGHDQHVLRGLSLPLEHILFEVHSGNPDGASAALERVAELGGYELRLSSASGWAFSAPMSPREILRSLPHWGNVYARRIR